MPANAWQQDPAQVQISPTELEQGLLQLKPAYVVL